MDTSTTASRLKIIRGDRAQAEIAQAVGIHKNTLSRYERGVQEPDFATARTICTLYGIEPRWLLFGEGPMRADDRQEPPTVAPQGEAAREPASVDPSSEIAALRAENRELRGENRELRQENRELRQENREVIKENADLRVELAEMKARAAPDKGSTEVIQGESARKIA